MGLKLKRHGKKVIFDSHEDVPKQLLGKRYLPQLLLRTLSLIFAVFERFACSGFDAIVGATPHISDKFSKFNARSIAINNFPLIGELEPNGKQHKRSAVAYIGAITEMRGIREMVHAIGCAEADVRLSIAGHFSEKELAEEMRKSSGWQLVDEAGYLDREGVRDLLSRSAIGLVTLRPSVNYIDALPIKMFEYMSAGVPVIASDFPIWRAIIEGNNCGICVDPLDPLAIDALTKDPECARKMGQNGRKAVQEKFNWTIEEKKLLNLYENLMSGQS
jgi:glycosyltransferase involved in cell wall biosynthesis